MSGGGSSAPAQPSTTTQIQDIPAWEQGYVTDLLGQAQTIAAQPYQQFPGQQVAGFTPDQTQAFSNIENAGNTNQAYQGAAAGQAAAGANSANNIYGAGAGDINASTMAASPQGIQAYMSPYTNDVVNGIQNEANLNWNQNIMPGVNNEFVGSGQYGSGRNAQVLGQAAGNFQTGLSSNIANALQSGYTTAGNQAATEAGLLNSAGTSLGNLASTQTGQQLNSANTLGNLGSQAAATNLTQNEALQATGQQQQQLNQTNLNTAQQNFENQVNYPAQQTEYLNQIIRGLPAPTATTSGSQTTPAYSVSPLSGIGGAGTTALALNGSSVGTLGAKTGGLIKGYAAGGSVDSDIQDIEDYGAEDPDYDPANPLSYIDRSPHQVDSANQSSAPMQYIVEPSKVDGGGTTPLDTANYKSDLQFTPPDTSNLNPLDMEKSKDIAPPPQAIFTPEQMQQNQLLALARGMLTPSLMGSTAAAFGTGLGNMQDVQMKQAQMQQAQNQLNYENKMKQAGLNIEQQKANQQQETIDQGRYTPVKDFYGNVTGMVEGKTGKFTPIAPASNTASVDVNAEPSNDPQKAAAQILSEQGTVPTQVGNKFDIAGRNKQVDAYNNAALAAKSTLQQLNVLDAQTGKYTPGKVMGTVYGGQSAIDMGGEGATARAEADKASKALANSFMAANVGSKGAGIRMVQFDAGAVPNADMTDEARTDLINKNKAIANSQIQRATISNLYPRMQMSNVNAIMDNYEQKNPPILPTGSANPNWMTYKDWLSAGRPDTTTLTGGGGNASSVAPAQPDLLAAIAAERAKRAGSQ